MPIIAIGKVTYFYLYRQNVGDKVIDKIGTGFAIII